MILSEALKVERNGKAQQKSRIRFVMTMYQVAKGSDRYGGESPFHQVNLLICLKTTTLVFRN